MGEITGRSFDGVDTTITTSDELGRACGRGSLSSSSVGSLKSTGGGRDRFFAGDPEVDDGDSVEEEDPAVPAAKASAPPKEGPAMEKTVFVPGRGEVPSWRNINTGL